MLKRKRLDGSNKINDFNLLNHQYDYELGHDIDSPLYIDSRERYDYLNFQSELKRKCKDKKTK